MRTEFDPRTGHPSKNPSRVVFPLRGLDMSPVLSSSSNSSGTNSGAGSHGNDNDNVNGDDGYIYDLFAAVVHHGRGMNEGHFTAYCYFKEQGIHFRPHMPSFYWMTSFVIVIGKWLLYNDANVTVADLKEVEESQAYLLFYERRHAIDIHDDNDDIATTAR
jgi:ubiquitin C-terminal hydrolase